MKELTKYRVVKSITGKCILEYLKVNSASDSCEWVPVKYNEAPRALVSQFAVQNKIKSLEIENAELYVQIESLEAQIKKLEMKNE